VNLFLPAYELERNGPGLAFPRRFRFPGELNDDTHSNRRIPHAPLIARKERQHVPRSGTGQTSIRIFPHQEDQQCGDAQAAHARHPYRNYLAFPCKNSHHWFTPRVRADTGSGYRFPLEEMCGITTGRIWCVHAVFFLNILLCLLAAMGSRTPGAQVAESAARLLFLIGFFVRP